MFKFLSKSTKESPRIYLGRKYKIIVGIASVVVSAVLVTITVNFITRAGILDPTAPPGDTSKTLDDIYSAMTIDTTATSYGLDSPAAPAATMHTLQEIYDVAVKRRLPDSGQDLCYNATVESACPVAGFPNQDAEATSTNSFTCDLSYTDNGDGTITDNCTGLMWQKCSVGLSGATCGTGTATTKTWTLALQECDNLNFPTDVHTDWRLPNVKELVSIINYANVSPSINTTYFPATVSGGYWSATTYKLNPSYAWYVNFNFGTVTSYSKTIGSYVRCVRGQ